MNFDEDIVDKIVEINRFAEKNLGRYNGWNVVFWETHQAAKADPSGTATKLYGALSKLVGRECSVDDLDWIRDVEIQRKLGVPEEFLEWHAYHHLEVINPNETVVNVLMETRRHGGDCYLPGIAKAVNFVADRMEAGDKGFFDASDVYNK